MEVALHNFWLERVFCGSLLIDLDTKARTCWQGDKAIFDLDRLVEYLVAPGHIAADRLLNQPVGRSQGEVDGGGGSDRAIGVVGRHRDRVGLGHSSDLTSLP